MEDLKEYRRTLINTELRGWVKVLVWLGVTQVKVFKTSIGVSYKFRELNPWNPLSYPLFVILFVLSTLWVGLRETIRQSKNAFRWIYE